MADFNYDNMTVDEIRQMILDNKPEFMAAIEDGKKLFNKFSRTYTADKFVWNVLHGIDEQSIRETKEAERAAVVVSDPDVLKRRAELQGDKAFLDRLNPRHKEVYREWFASFNKTNGNGDD